jgi:hypothetical protein
MAQHDYDIANQSGANFRADLNNALDAIVSNNSGSSQPSTTFAYEWWVDTSANLLKLRNSANNAWITLPLSITASNETSGALTVNGNLTTTGTVDVNGQELILDADADTSITADSDDQIDIRVGNVDVATLTNSHLVLKGTAPKITIGDGGEEDTALIFDGNAQDFYIGLDDSADDLIIGTGSTVGTNPILAIKNNGNIGIDEANPTEKLELGDGSATNRIRIDSATKAHFFGYDGSDDAIQLASQSFIKFQSGGSFLEAMRIDSSGQLGIGTTAPHTTMVVNGGTFADIALQSSNSGTGSSQGGLVSIDTSNNLYLWNFENAPTIFGTNNTERMRVDNDGKLLIATTSASRTTSGHEFHTDGFARHTVDGDKSLEAVRTSSDGEVFEIFKDNTLKQTMGTASNSIFSDKKVKKDIKSLELGLDLIKKLNPKEYRHIVDDDDSPMSFGLIAQEFEKSLEEVGVEKNSTYLLQYKPSEESTNSDYWLDYQKLTPILIKAIQELEERVKTLED